MVAPLLILLLNICNRINKINRNLYIVRFSYFKMEITRLSTKGQIVIPESVRKGFEPGSSFKVIRKGDLIVLKEVEQFTKEEIAEMKELDKIWKNIDEGNCKSYSVDAFFEEMKKW